MKTFCPQCGTECFVTKDTARSMCCDQPAFIGCSVCSKRLVQLSVVIVGPNPGPITCYACQKKALKPKRKAAFA